MLREDQLRILLSEIKRLTRTIEAALEASQLSHAQQYDAKSQLKTQVERRLQSRIMQKLKYIRRRTGSVIKARSAAQLAPKHASNLTLSSRPRVDANRSDTRKQSITREISLRVSDQETYSTVPQSRRPAPSAVRMSHDDIPLLDAKSASSPLRVDCKLSQIGPQMISTIMQAREMLGTESVDRRGYLILAANAPQSSSHLTQVLRNCPQPDIDVIHGFAFRKCQGQVMHAYRDRTATANPKLCPEFIPSPSEDYADHISAHQAWFDNPPERVTYLICPPLKEHAINNFPKAGTRLLQQPQMAGVNTPYWYLNFNADSPALLHIEPGVTGSAHMLLAGADKHWLIVHRNSARTLEQCIRSEFEGSSTCSQFVRHHDLLVSPQWLNQRNINFEVVRQKPGDIFVTLPGRIYHQVRNLGPNFAVAINFELPDSPVIPLDYIWCDEGAQSCGKSEFTLRDFAPANQQSLQHDQASKVQAEEPIEIDDEEDQKCFQPVSDLSIPEQHEDPDTDVLNLIETCLKQRLNAMWFDCANEDQLEKKLRRFSPGSWLDDSLLRRLLQIISSPRNFFVVESVQLDARVPNATAIMSRLDRDFNGLIFPFNMNDVHWALGIYDDMSSIWTTFDVGEHLSQKWASSIAEGLAGLGRQRPKIETQLGVYPQNLDGGSCALCCCLALDRYFNSGGCEETPGRLRSHYLRKLLRHYQLSGPYEKLLNRPIASGALATLRSFDTDMTSRSTAGEKKHNSIQECFAAAHFSHTSLKIRDIQMVSEREARVLQMLLQCSSDHVENVTAQINGPVHDLAGNIFATTRDILEVMREIENNSKEFYLPVLRRRLLFMELDLRFRCELQKETTTMKSERKRRNRMKAAGEILPALTNRNKTTRTRVLERLDLNYGNERGQLSRKRRNAMLNFISYGASLNDLVTSLGFGSLMSMPVHTIEGTDISLSIPCRASLCKSLEPIEYCTMTRNDRDFFILWYPRLHRTWEQWNNKMDSRLLHAYQRSHGSTMGPSDCIRDKPEAKTV